VKVALVADCHVASHKRLGGDRVASLNERCRRTLDVFTRAVERSLELDCAAFVVLGDLLDSQRPEPQILAAIQTALAPAKAAGMAVYLLVGNHDQVSDQPGDHALGPLAPFATIVDRPTIIHVDGRARPSGLLGLVPFRTGAADAWLPETLQGFNARVGSTKAHRLLGVHLGVRDSATAPWLKTSTDAIDVEVLAAAARDAGFGSVAAGNWHNRRSWTVDGVEVLQVGALVPTGWDNPNVAPYGSDPYGTLAVWEDGVFSNEVLPGPRFVLTDAAGLSEAVRWAEQRGHTLYAQVKAPPESLAAAVAALEASGVAGEVVVDGKAVEAKAREAAEAASSSKTVEAALAAYLDRFPLEPGVSKEALDEAVRGYLAR